VSARRPLILLAIALTALLGAGVAGRLGGASGRDAVRSIAVAAVAPGGPPAPALRTPQPNTEAADAHTDTASSTDPAPDRAAREEGAPATATDPAPERPAVSLAVRIVDTRGAPVRVHMPSAALVAETPDGPCGSWTSRDGAISATFTVALDARFVGRFLLSADGGPARGDGGAWVPPGIQWSSEVVTVALAPGENGPVDLPLLAPAPLTVRVLDTEGRPLEGVALRLEFDAYAVRHSLARTGPDGVTVLAAQDTLVGAATLHVKDHRTDRTDARALVLGTAPSTVEVVLPVAPPVGTLLVRVVHADGRSAAYEGGVVVKRARPRSGTAGEAAEDVVRSGAEREEDEPRPPREERFTLPPASYLVGVAVGDGPLVAGPFEVASGETTSADIAVPAPGLLVVRPAPGVGAPEPGEGAGLLEVRIDFTDTGGMLWRQASADGDVRIEGVGPVTLLASTRDAPYAAASAVLVPGATTVVEVARRAFGGIRARLVDRVGAAILIPLSVEASGIGRGGEAISRGAGTGGPPHDVWKDVNLEGEASPGVGRFVNVPPGPWTLEAFGVSVTVEVRSGETAEATIVLPVDGAAFERETLAARAPWDEEEAARAADPDAEPSPSDEPRKGTLEALVVDDVGRPVPGAEVLYESDHMSWDILDRAGPGRASDRVYTGAYVLRARAPDRLDGPPVRAEVTWEGTTSVRLSPGPREGAATLVVRARAPGFPEAPWVVVSDAEAGPSAMREDDVTQEGALLERSLEADLAGRVEVGGLPTGRLLRVALFSDEHKPHRSPAQRAALAAAPGALAFVTLAPGERREVDLALPEAARVTAGPAAVVGGLVALETGTLAFHEEPRPAPEGQALFLLPGTYAIGFARARGGVCYEGLREVTLTPGERVAWDAPPPEDVVVRGLYRRAATDPDDGGTVPWLLGPGVAIALHDGYIFFHDRLPAGRYALRIGGREVRSWEAAPGQTLDLDFAEGR